MKIRRAKALWKVPELWKNQKAVFPQLLGPSVHTSHNAGCRWTFLKHNFSSTPGTATAVRTRVFRVEIRLSSRTQCAAGGGSRPWLRDRREAMGRGPGLGKVLRPSEPRGADGTSGAQGGGQTGVEGDPALSGSRADGRRSGERRHRGHPARRTVVPAAVEHSADRSGRG